MQVRLTESTVTPSFIAICDRARLWSRYVSAVKFSAGMDGAADLSSRQLVLAGLAITTTLMSLDANSSIAAPCSAKIGAFFAMRSLRSIPCFRGNPPATAEIGRHGGRESQVACVRRVLKCTSARMHACTRL